MSYWNVEEYQKTRKQLNPVSEWFRPSKKDKRPVLCQVIDSMVLSLTSRVDDIDLDNLGFESLGRSLIC